MKPSALALSVLDLAPIGSGSSAVESLRASGELARLAETMGYRPPIWLLGSSGASARLAGSLGLGYSFASRSSAAPARHA